MTYINEVTITDMMNCRERRVHLQSQLLQTYQTSILSFCMNIPGPMKTDPVIAKAFEAGKEQILNTISKNRISINEQIELREKTGDELLLSVDFNAKALKSMMSEIEESHPLGRIFDIDIIDTDGHKLSRNSYRKCLICEKQAQECARSRTHSVAEMIQKIHEMIESFS